MTGAMGEHKLFFEDVQAGRRGPGGTHVLTRTDLVRYAGASGDFNPMHHDEVQAQAAGQPSVFGHGMFSMGLLGSAITDYVGIGNLTHYKVRFSRQTWPDEKLTTKVVVVGQAGGGRTTPDRPRRAPGQPGGRGEGGRRGHRRPTVPGLIPGGTARRLAHTTRTSRRRTRPPSTSTRPMVGCGWVRRWVGDPGLNRI